MNKVLSRTVALVAAATISSFAAWDYFPIPEKGNVQARVGSFVENKGTDAGEPGMFVQARFVPVQNLEVSIYNADGYTLGARYQFIPVFNAYVDVVFPMAQENWEFTPGVQFSTAFNDLLSIGADLHVSIPTEDNLKNSDGMALGAGVELDFAASQMFVPYVGFSFETGLTKGKELGVETEASGNGYAPYIGVGINATSALSLGTSVTFAMAEHEDIATGVNFDATVSF